MLWPQSLKSFAQSPAQPKWVRWLIAYLPTMLWASLIFWFSSQSDLPTLEEPAWEWLWKKTAHFLVYGALYFWLWWGTGLLQTKSLKNLHQILWLLLIVVFYAASDEYHQSFIATRHPSVTDIGIDFLGGSAAAAALYKFTGKHD